MFNTCIQRMQLQSSHDVFDRQIQADHLAWRMTYTNALTLWTRHHYELGCHSTAPENGHFAF
jgi:hypothetical protein